MTLQKIFNIKYPIIQGGMANISNGSFAAAVSNAGALGLIGAGGMSCEILKKEIAICKSLTDKPFGVNIMLMNPESDAMAQLVIDEKILIVTTGAGNPAKYMPAWKSAGIKIFPVVAAISLAKRMQQLGADGIIAEGTESGGHVGESTTMALLPQIVNAVNIPVVAAGGIACGQQLLAAFALGACGVQVGTCLLASKECPVHENYKQAIISACGNDTVVTGRISGTPVRIIKNKMAREYLKMEKGGASKIELEHFTLGSLRKAVLDGDIMTGSVMAGQAVGLVTQKESLEDIFKSMVDTCKTTLSNLQEKLDEI